MESLREKIRKQLADRYRQDLEKGTLTINGAKQMIVHLQNALEKMKMPTRVMTAIEMQRIAEPYIRRRAIRHLEKGRIVIFVAGTGNPYFTTDTAAALKGMEINADAILKGTKVDGIYSADPMKDKRAVRYDAISYDEVIDKQLGVMDATAITFCRENRIPIIVFKLLQSGNLKRIILGEKIGSIVRGGIRD